MFKFRIKYWSAITVILAGVFTSCSQPEGVGGNSHIKGRLMVNYYNNDFTALLSSSPEAAYDEDVYIVFGDQSVIGDDVTTSNTGDFAFEYLWPGKYTLYYYSDDTTGLTDDKVPVVKEITLGKNETLDLGDLLINRKLKINEGSAFIKGQITINYYNDDYSLLLSQEPAADEDVFIVFANGNIAVDDTKTSYSGHFAFNNVWPGSYQLYYYSDDSTGSSIDKVAVVENVTVDKGETVELNNLVINKTLDWDEGTSSITGTVFEVNYKNSSSYPNLEINYIAPSVEQDIYITYGNHSFYDERVRTDGEGKFMFKNLIKGKYKITMYSDDVTGESSKVVIEKQVEITNDNTAYPISGIIYVENL